MNDIFCPKNRKRDIKNYLKNKLNLSYKKGSSTTKSGDSEHTKLLQSIFSDNILDQIYDNKYLVSIDEAWFNRDLKKNYSWLPKGCTGSIINLNTKGFCSIIVALFSNGEYILQIVASTIYQTKFQEFLCIVHFVVKTQMKDDMERIIITLDNASVHTSLNIKRLFEYLNFQTSFLPPYSPKLPTVELFFNIIKAKIRSLWAEIDIDFSKNSGRDWTFTAV